VKAPWWLAALGPLALAAALRVPWLGAMPTPCGDEGNWALLGLRLSQGLRAGLPSEAAFVTTAFAWMIAGAFRVLGASFASARAVPVAATLLAVAAVVRLSERRREGVAIALVVALHPWSVLWSRTVSVPYALSLSLAVVGPLAWLDALRTRSPWRLLFASQLLGVALHFSPLALVPIGAVALWTAQHRVAWRHAPIALSGLVHAAPIVSGALVAMRVGRQVTPPLQVPLAERLSTLVAMLLGDVSGTSTAAHFAGCAPWVTRLGALVALAVIVGAMARARESALSRFAAMHLALACVGVPLLLVPARAWSMPVIDADRYGFALVAPVALAVGALASSSRAWRAVALAYVLWLAGVTAGVAHHFARGGGGDLGLFVAHNGGRYRGWQVAQGRRPLPEMLRDDALAAASGEPAVIAYTDYAFHALRFSLAVRGNDAGLTHAIGWPAARPGARVFFVTWRDETFARGYRPRRVVAARRADERRIVAEYDDARVVRQYVMADGTPLCALWSARAR
jgi:hypothetical protein